MHTVELAKKIENVIKLHLIGARLAKPEDYTIPRLYIYDFVVREYSKYGIITTGFFSRIVGDMKKTGIIGTAKGGDVLFVTDAYWELSGSKERFEKRKDDCEKLAIEVIKQLEVSPKRFDGLMSVAHDSVLLAEVIRGLLKTNTIEQHGDLDEYRLTLDAICKLNDGGAR